METVVFVYNATSGVIDKFIDSAHKILSPETYQCSLCKLTHGNFGEKQDWIDFKDQMKPPLKFLYKNEFEEQYKSKWLGKYEYPIVFLASGYALDPILTSKDLQEITSLDILIDTLKEVLSEGFD